MLFRMKDSPSQDQVQAILAKNGRAPAFRDAFLYGWGGSAPQDSRNRLVCPREFETGACVGVYLAAAEIQSG